MPFAPLLAVLSMFSNAFQMISFNEIGYTVLFSGRAIY